MCGLKQTFRLFNAKILQIVDRCRSGRALESMFEASLRNVARSNGSSDRMRLPEMLRKPVLRTANDRVCVRLVPHQACVRQLALAVQLQEINLGDPQGLSRTAMARSNVNREVVPRCFAACGDNPAGRVGNTRFGSGFEPDFGETIAE